MLDRIKDILRSLIVRGLILERGVWSWVMVIGATSRALSYWVRPPETSTPTAARIEGALSYTNWTILLLTYAAIISIGMITRRGGITWLGHLMGLGASATLALSIFFAAVFDGASWSAFWPLVVVGLVHFGRINALGAKLTPPVVIKRKETRTP